MKNIKRILCAVLCLCMITGTLLTLASCDKEEPKETGEEVVSVVKVAQDIEAGTEITADMIKVENITVSNVHLNAIRDSEKVVGKIASQKLYAGEYIFASKLKNKANAEGDSSSNLIVTEHIELGADVADALQKLINDNPGRTIEFPDGEYIISKPITVPADTAKAVSLRLSDYAVIKAADSWSGDDAMIKLADGERAADEEPNSFYLTGGTIDANGKAKAISIGNAKDILVANVDILDAVVGVEIISGAADIENIIITGTGDESSVGLIFGGDDSSAANIRVTNVFTGVKVTGANNSLKSVFASTDDTSKDSCGFYDIGTGSRFDMCQSEQFSVAYRMGENARSTFYGCYAKWDNDESGQHWAFKADKKYNSLIRNCRADFDFADCDGSLLAIGETGGKGQIVYPMISGKDNMVGTAHKTYLLKYGEETDPVVYID